MYGLYCGDHHIHAAGCAHYTNPTEGVFAQDMFLHVKGEGPQRRLQSDLGALLRIPAAILRADRQQDQRAVHRAQVRHRSQRVRLAGAGPRCLLNLAIRPIPAPKGTKTKGWPTWTTPLMRWAKNQGAYTGYAHSANGLGINPEAASKRIFEQLGFKDEKMPPPTGKEKKEPGKELPKKDRRRMADYRSAWLAMRSCQIACKPHRKKA